MKISTVTITGADDATSYTDIRRLTDRYPFVEWGILFSPDRYDTERYPSKSWVQSLFNYFHFNSNFPKFSAHLCGEYTKEILQTSQLTKWHLEVGFPKDFFKRYQWNFNASKVGHLVFSPEFIEAQSHCVPEHSIIIQHNGANKPVIDKILNYTPKLSNVHFLYDSSGGRGITAQNILPPVPGYFTGYSGGLGLDNLEEFLKKLDRVVGVDIVWIDAETNLRTDGKLDMQKVQRFLEIAKPYVI